MRRVCLGRLSFTIALLLTLSTVAFGQQSVLRGSIAGTITDETGAAMPGVTVTVTSPALQVENILRVSNERGEYQIIDLPSGTYRVAYELPGFATMVREGLVLTTGFNARVDISMKVATLAETVTVSGESPLVDVTSTRGGTTVSQDLIEAIPGNRNYTDVMLLAGGTTVSGPPLTGVITAGGGGFAGRTYGSGNGATGGGSVAIDGVKIMQNQIMDFTTYEEVDVKTFGNTADVDTPGVSVQLVVKSGGNEFHGRFEEIAQHRRFQSNNLDDALRAQGLTAGNAVIYYNDISADLGGRIIRNKLWFYGAARDMHNKVTVAGYSKAPGPDGVYDTIDDIPGEPPAFHISLTAKLSYQATQNHRFVFMTQDNPDYAPEQGAARFIPFESNRELNQYSWDTKPIQWQGTLTSRLLADMTWGHGRYDAVYRYLGPWEAGCMTACPNRFNRATGQNTGPFFGEGAARRTPVRKQVAGSLTYLPEGNFLGTHELNTGYRFWWGYLHYENPVNPEINAGKAEYRLIFDTVGGVPNQPVEMAVINFPLKGVFRENSYAAFIQDTWRPTRRLTMNVGLRWERQIHFVPASVKPQGTFGNSGSFPQVDAGAWNRLAPRFGMAYDLSGDGKTVVKGTYGWFNDDLGLREYSVTFAQNQPLTYTYRWRDLNGDRNWQPNENSLDPNGPDFLSISAVGGFGALGAGNTVVNPDLRLPHTHEITASMERELGNGLAVRGLYVYKRLVDQLSVANIKRPYEVWNRAFSRQDPGPDGVLRTADDGAMFTIYDYDPAYRGAANVLNSNQNRETDRQDRFNNFEIMLTKRPTGKWFANTAFLATKNHRYLNGSLLTPNDAINGIDETWDFNYRLAGGYNAPYGINFSTLYQAYSGIQRQRTVVFRAADPAGGPAFPSSSTLTIPVEEFGAVRGKPRHIVNLRGEKEFRFGAKKFRAAIDAFNAFNSNVPWGGGGNGSGITDTSGPTYGYVVRIVTPRVLRFAVSYDF
jgi:hypothetical protein